MSEVLHFKPVNIHGQYELLKKFSLHISRHEKITCHVSISSVLTEVSMQLDEKATGFVKISFQKL